MNRRETGVRYEEVAARALYARGYRILERNFRCRFGEIDIVARHKGVRVFVEVKYRRDLRSGFPEEAVDRRKQEAIRRTAEVYMHRHGYDWWAGCRFDVVAIAGEDIRVIEDAFWTE